MIINISDIRIDGNTQSRTKLNDDVVYEYSQSINDGAKFPPVKLFFDGSNYWLADGFHRYHATKSLGHLQIEADVINGTNREAIFHSLTSNISHGLRRTNADKQHAVKKMLADKEWSTWSDNAIAKELEISNHLVAKVRQSSLGEFQVTPLEPAPLLERTFINKHGTESKMNVSAIGKSNSSIPEFEPQNELSEIESESEYSEIDQLRDTVSELNEIIQDLRAQVAIGTSGDVDDVSKIISELRNENKSLKANLDAVTKSRDQSINECNQRLTQIKILEKKLKSLTKA